MPTNGYIYRTIENIDFTYKGGEKVLSNVNLLAKSGNIVAIVGPSGEGKTTIMRIILGLINPQSGKSVMRAFTVFMGKIPIPL